jgi:hypothetical protein
MDGGRCQEHHEDVSVNPEHRDDVTIELMSVVALAGAPLMIALAAASGLTLEFDRRGHSLHLLVASFVVFTVLAVLTCAVSWRSRNRTPRSSQSLDDRSAPPSE